MSDLEGGLGPPGVDEAGGADGRQPTLKELLAAVPVTGVRVIDDGQRRLVVAQYKGERIQRCVLGAEQECMQIADESAMGPMDRATLSDYFRSLLEGICAHSMMRNARGEPVGDGRLRGQILNALKVLYDEKKEGDLALPGKRGPGRRPSADKSKQPNGRTVQ